MKTIIDVGLYLPNNDSLQFDSKGSLSDADIVVFNSNLRNTSYRIDWDNSSFQGKQLYNADSSFAIQEHSSHWKDEIASFLKTGKTLFVTLTKKEDFYIHTGQKETSGTGKNQKVTKIVKEFDNYQFLPITNVKISASEGSKIYANSNLIKNLWTNIQKELSFESYITVLDKSDIEILFTTKNKDKILGVMFKVVNGGFIIFLPAINFPDDFYTEDADLTEKAIVWGKKFNNNLIEIDKTIRSSIERTPIPDWVNMPDFQLIESQKTKELIEQNNHKIHKIQEETQQLEEVLLEQETLKDLLFETGKPLEFAVIKALKILGYQAENYDDGVLELDQIIVSPEGDRFIGECEGKDNKDIDISKFRQLQDALNEDFEREEVKEKAFGLLIGNPQRLILPTTRTLDFTDKCKKAANREKIGLIKTVDLFEITKYLSENEDKDFASACRKAIKKQLGTIIIFPMIPKK